MSSEDLAVDLKTDDQPKAMSPPNLIPDKTPSSTIVYSRDELIELSKLPASKVKPSFFQSGFTDESGFWSPTKTIDRPSTTNSGSVTAPSKVSEQDLKTRLGPQNPGNWFRGCDPKNQDTKTGENSVQTPNGKPGDGVSMRPRLDTLERSEVKRGREIPVRDAIRRDSQSGSGSYEWRSDKGRGMDREQMERPPLTGRFANLDYDSRSRGGSRSQSFNSQSYGERRGRDDGRFGNNNYNSHRGQHNGYNNEESTPEWMDEPTSKFEMMDLGGFEDDHRGKQETNENKKAEVIPEEEPRRTPSREQVHDSTPEERSVTPEFERLMKDMWKITDEDIVSETAVEHESPRDFGSKSSRWFGGQSGPQDHQSSGHEVMRSIPGQQDFPRPGRQPTYEQSMAFQQQRHHQMSQEPGNDLMQILQRARINMNNVPSRQSPPQMRPQFRSLDEIEANMRSGGNMDDNESGSSSEDKQAFNKLMDMLSRRGSGTTGQQPPRSMTHEHVQEDRRPTSFELEELHRRKRIMEAEAQMQQQMQSEQHQSLPQKRSFAPAFNMVPIQVIRNANATDRRGLLPSAQEMESPSHGPRAIVGSGRASGVTRLPSGYGPDPLEMQRQMMMNQEMMQRRMNVSPINARPFPAANAIPINRPGDVLMSRPLLGHPSSGIHAPNSELSQHRMQQIQQLQLVNQQLHQMNPSQLQQTRGMNPAQIQQFLMRS